MDLFRGLREAYIRRKARRLCSQICEYIWKGDILIKKWDIFSSSRDVDGEMNENRFDFQSQGLYYDFCIDCVYWGIRNFTKNDFVIIYAFNDWA